MKKYRLAYIAALIAVLALCLCACTLIKPDDTGGGDQGQTDTGSWTTITSPNMTDVYTKFLGGFTSVADEFTKSRLKTSPKVCADGLFEIKINQTPLWGILRLNYNDEDKSSVMAAIELSKDKDEYSNNILALYLYKEQLFIKCGETTHFSLDFTPSMWGDFFPLENVTVGLDTVALFMNTVIVTSAPATGKSRMNGTAEEYNYCVSIDVSQSLQKILNSDKSIGNMESYATILASIFGVTLEDVKNGDFPESTLYVDFTTSNMKMAAFNMSMEVKGIKNHSDTIFNKESFTLEVNLAKLNIGKNNVSIPFVWDEYAADREKYVYYRDNAFKVTFDSTVNNGGENKKYAVDFKAKVFQEYSLDNYAFVEFKDPTDGKPQRGLYVYKNIGYLYERQGAEYVCKLKMPFDLSDIASRTVANNFGKEGTGMNWLDFAGYLLSGLTLTAENHGVTFDYDIDFYKYVWFNFNDMLEFVNAQIEEDILTVQPLKDFIDFAVNSPAVIMFAENKPVITVVADGSTELTAITSMLQSADPEIVLTALPCPTMGTEEADPQ